MTAPHEPDSPLEPPLDAAREEAVRRTLAEAGGPETTPAEVVARLDGVLEDLVAERRTPSVSHPESAGIVIPMDAAARRRRIRVRALLGAAAAVVAVGVGAGVIQGQPGSDDKTMSAEGTAADEAPARDDTAAGLEADQSTDSPAAPEVAASAGDQATPQDTLGDTSSKYALELRRVVTDGPVRAVRPDHLREDLVALQHVSVPKLASADYAIGTLSAPDDFMCGPAAYGAGYLVGVTYGGKPALVAFREPVGDNQEAEVLACGTGDVLHSTVLATTG